MNEPVSLVPGYTWIDGVARNATSPKTFEIPSTAAKAAIKPGDFVKVGIEGAEGGEHFWTEVTAVAPNCAISGVVDSRILQASEFGINFGDLVQFEPRHVLMIIKADELP